MINFDAVADGWDNPARLNMAKTIAAYIIEHISIKPAARLVDIGAGTGIFGLSFLDRVESLYFIDSSRGMLTELERKLKQADITNCGIIQHDISLGPAPGTGLFDIAVSLLSFHHIPDIGSALTSVRQMLAAGGVFCLVDLAPEDGSFHQGKPDIPHLGFEPETLSAAALQAGFRQTEFHFPYTMTRSGENGSRDYPLVLMIAGI